MELLEAVRASGGVQGAVRSVIDDWTDRRPNVVLMKGGKARAYRADVLGGWQPRSLRIAKLQDDWIPAKNREMPVYFLPGAACELCGVDIGGQVDDGSGSWVCSGGCGSEEPVEDVLDAPC